MTEKITKKLATKEQKNIEEHTILYKNEFVRIVKIFSYGFACKEEEWFCGDEDELACVTQGSAIIKYEDGEILLRAGEHVFLPAQKKHRLSYTSNDCEWLCIYMRRI